LLRVTDPVASNKDGDGIRAADCVFQRRDPTKTWTKLILVKERAEATIPEPTVQLTRRKRVAAGIAQKNVKSAIASHLGSLTVVTYYNQQRFRFRKPPIPGSGYVLPNNKKIGSAIPRIAAAKQEWSERLSLYRSPSTKKVRTGWPQARVEYLDSPSDTAARP
jgi:hypothetical protein